MVTLKGLRERVQQKPELKELGAGIVERAVRAVLEQEHVRVEQLREEDVPLIVKEVRRELHALAGRFQRSTAKRKQLLAARHYDALLRTHVSSAARIADYVLLRKELEHRNVRTVLDLGCGLNPIALARKGMTYHAVDIREDELSLVAAFFRQEGIQGTTQLCDLRYEIPALEQADACLLMNVLDVLERNGHKRAEQLLNSIDARYFFITFSTKTLSGKPMRHPQRGWIERLLTRREYVWKRIKLRTEILYIAQAPPPVSGAA